MENISYKSQIVEEEENDGMAGGVIEWSSLSFTQHTSLFHLCSEHGDKWRTSSPSNSC